MAVHENADFVPSDTVVFSPDGEGLAYSVQTGAQPQRTVAVVNGHEGPMEEEARDVRIFHGPTRQDVAYMLGATANAEAKLVINGASISMPREGMSVLRFTTDAKHVIGMGRKGIMADGTTLAVKADRLWNLQEDGTDRFSVFVCRGRNPQGIPEQFLKLGLQITSQGSETSKKSMAGGNL